MIFSLIYSILILTRAAQTHQAGRVFETPAKKTLFGSFKKKPAAQIFENNSVIVFYRSHLNVLVYNLLVENDLKIINFKNYNFCINGVFNVFIENERGFKECFLEFTIIIQSWILCVQIVRFLSSVCKKTEMDF